MDEVKVTTKNAWNRFLLTPEGIEGMLYARESAPGIASKEQAAIVFEAGVAQGYKMALDRLTAFTSAAPVSGASLENSPHLG